MYALQEVKTMSKPKSPCVYILASQRNGTLYIGVTSSLGKRMAEHSQGLIEGFTKKYGVKMLVWHNRLEDMKAAINREKQLKQWQRSWKIRLIEEMNPEWVNLYDEVNGEISCGPLEAERLSADPVRD